MRIIFTTFLAYFLNGCTPFQHLFEDKQDPIYEFEVKQKALYEQEQKDEKYPFHEQEDKIEDDLRKYREEINNLDELNNHLDS